MSSIEDLIAEKGITRICHFTRSNKLPHILSKESGIVANTELDDQIELLSQNDPLRLDGKQDYVCCTIQYPNTWYLRKIKDKDPLFKQWVVLLINPKLAALSTTLYCHRNAAASHGAFIKEGVEGFAGMFKQSVQGQRIITRTPRMLPCCPTDDQAEVLIYKNISRSAILGVAVPTEEQARIEKARLRFVGGVPEDIPFIIAPDLFEVTWSGAVRNGQVPSEILYREG
ncbi:DarT ssDNA thymidine ADP-ribosyltransferase family protein [Paenibacillus protaetiae]|nr:DarT ssDNA thymidine ADP-ribosyltransferase family protein [Paenibacillus protaetiae]